MTAEVFAWTCHTCDESGVEDGFERAQELFGDHADEGCEVVLRKVDPKREPSTGSPHTEGSANGSSPVDGDRPDDASD